MVYIDVNGRRILGYDNAEGKGHHRHVGDDETPFKFESLEALTRTFLDEVSRPARKAPMKTKSITIKIQSLAEGLQDFVRVAQAIQRGHPPKTMIDELAFESLEAMRRVLYAEDVLNCFR